MTSMKGDLVGRSLRRAEVQLPALVVRQAALSSNISRMAEFCREHDVLIAPHAKTHMTHEIAAQQLEAGAWGLSVATVEQSRSLRRAGPQPPAHRQRGHRTREHRGAPPPA
jgi:D-serine deaminase-like pyridoxal phosphate-dependent protein